MELNIKHSLQYNPDTLKYLRKIYNLDTQERIDEAIDILVKWVQKQEHFIKKEYSKDMLEKALLSSKGSIERLKEKLDKVATFKTLLPNFYEPLDVRNSKILKNVHCSLLPKMTKDHDRVLIAKVVGDDFPNTFDVYKYSLMICEFALACDYTNRKVGVFDTRDCNVVELIKSINFVDLRQTISVIVEGYKFRIKSIHFVTTSKAMDVIITVFKQVLSSKLRQRMYVHNTAEELHDYLPREILPKDFGGDEKPMKDLSEDLMDVLASEEFTKYFNECRLAKTNEDFRSVEKFNDECISMAGSFRKLIVD